MHAVRRSVVLALGVVTAPALGAQDLQQVCGSVGKVTVGQWASYSGSGGQMNGATLRLAIVDSERHGDTTLYWFEINQGSTGDAGRGEILQLLVPGFGLDASEVRGAIVKLGAAPAVRVDQMLPLVSGRLGQSNPALEFARRCAGSHALGWETVAVPAGRIRALHARDAEGWEAWVSPDVPFGFVQLHATDGGQLVLTGKGTDAKSSIAVRP